MSELPRILPSLADRFTRPGEHYSYQSVRAYSDAVLRDLRALLGARAHLTPDEIQEFSEVAKSVLNYGLYDLAGKRVRNVDVPALEKQLLETIYNFEPRIKKHTLTVEQASNTGDGSDETGRALIAFEIEGEVWASPTPIKIRTELDLATGQHTIAEGAEASDLPRKPAGGRPG